MRDRLHRLLRSCLGASVIGLAALLVLVAWPHQHSDGSAAAHPASICRLCRVHEGFAATPTAAAATPHVPAPIIAQDIAAHDAPRAVLHRSASAPRSPPASS